jgi:glycosyltransferase involved in cell wall biosynthesis
MPWEAILRILIIGGIASSLVNFRGALIKTMLGKGYEVWACAGEPRADVAKTLSDAGARFVPIHMARTGMQPWAELRTLWELWRLMRRVSPDIILAYTVKPVIWGGIAARVATGTKFYALITGLGFAFNGRSAGRRFLTIMVTFLYTIALGKAHGVIFQNNDDRAEFVSRKIVPLERTVIVNGSGVDLEQFAPSALPDSPPTFLAIARLLQEKGLREYAEAARKVKERYPRTIFRLLGPVDPSPDGIPFDEVRQWQLHGWIEYLGEARDVRPFITDCHVYVLPSYHEGMPRSVLEAMAMGRPILTTDVPGCRETVINGENGFLVPARNSAALAERMEWFIENPGEWARMGTASRRMAENRFDVRAINSKLMQIMGMEHA